MTLSVQMKTSEDTTRLGASGFQARENHLECQELSAGSLFMDIVISLQILCSNAQSPPTSALVAFANCRTWPDKPI